jgi:hypothetical protein
MEARYLLAATQLSHFSDIHRDPGYVDVGILEGTRGNEGGNQTELNLEKKKE